MSNQTGRFTHTPAKGLNKMDQQGMTTADRKKQRNVAQSHYEPHSSQDPIDTIQSRIHAIGQRLRQLHNKMMLQTDKLSDDYLEMETERKQLKKELIELDYEHKLLCTGKMRESKRVNEEKMEQIRKQYEQKISKMKQVPQKNEQNNKEEESLAESRRKLRMAEIQAQLAESKLRRSRMERLNSELSYLRLTYTDPYLWRSYIYWPRYSYLYPYDYLYPYYSSYYYRRWLY